MKPLFLALILPLIAISAYGDRVTLSVSSIGQVTQITDPIHTETLLTTFDSKNINSIGIKPDPFTLKDNEFADVEEDSEVIALKKLDPIDFNIKESTLTAAIRLCAKACNMNYIAPPSGKPFNQSITLDIRSNPFLVLSLICQTYNIGMEHKDGIWQFYPINLNELIQKAYRLKYNTQEQLKINSPSVNNSINESNANAFGSTGNAAGSDVFAVKPNVVVEEIQKILDLPTTGIQAFSELDNIDTSAQAYLSSTSAPKGSVIYSPDNNELIVVATRQQHSYIEKYLTSVDKPQRLVKIETMLVETSRNPQSDFGVDWSGVSGTKIGLKDIQSNPINLNHSLSGIYMPFATLSASDMAVTLNFIKSDRESSITQNPTVVTLNNKEVALKSVQQQPIESGSSQETTIGGVNSVATIDYIEIGTIINIHPKIIDDHKSDGSKSVQLSVSLVVSSQVGHQQINHKEYPIISSRTYNYTVIVPSGGTLAIGGLTETYCSTTEKKVPVLGDLPFVGGAFSNKAQTQRRCNLVAYITPSIID